MVKRLLKLLTNKKTKSADDTGNLTMEQRSGVDVDKRDENVRYYYDRADQLIKTVIEGVTTTYPLTPYSR